MLDFPNTPTDGDVHTEDGKTWIYVDGAWAALGEGSLTPIDIVEADASAGWQVWGDVLIQWGYGATDGTGNAGVPFPQAFKDTGYRFVAMALFQAGLGDDRGVQWQGSATTGINVVGTVDGGFGVVGFNWIAVGEAPDHLKQPKTVQTIGGTELQEFHDPTNVASWRIVGNTLECWGFVNTDPATGAAITFPKTFKQNPIPTVSPMRGTGIAHVQATLLNTTGMIVFGWVGGVGAVVTAFWHVKGEWDGVS